MRDDGAASGGITQLLFVCAGSAQVGLRRAMDITDEMVYLCRDDGDTAATLGPNGLVGGTAIKVHPWMVKEMLMGWLLADDTEEGPPLTGWYLSSYDARADMPVQRARGASP